MPHGTAIIKLEGPSTIMEWEQRAPKHRDYVRGWKYTKLWTGWTRLLRLCRNLNASGLEYGVCWEFGTEGNVVAIVGWQSKQRRYRDAAIAQRQEEAQS